jgi:hypothetical protein
MATSAIYSRANRALGADRGGSPGLQVRVAIQNRQREILGLYVTHYVDTP